MKFFVFILYFYLSTTVFFYNFYELDIKSSKFSNVIRLNIDKIPYKNDFILDGYLKKIKSFHCSRFADLF